MGTFRQTRSSSQAHCTHVGYQLTLLAAYTHAFAAIGIIGATVMPHSLFLGSALATQDRLSHKTKPVKLSTIDSTLSSDSDNTSFTPDASDRLGPSSLMEYARFWVRRHLRVVPVSDLPNEPKSHAERENRPYEVVRAHLYHGIVDMVISLLGLAVVINSMSVISVLKSVSSHWLTVIARILILSSAVFFNRNTGPEDPADLFDAFDLLKDTIGKRTSICIFLSTIVLRSHHSPLV